MRRKAPLVAALVSTALSLGAAPLGVHAAGAARVNVALVWHVESPAAGDASVRAMDVALSAPATLGSILHALRSHSGARVAVALAPDVLNSLEEAASGDALLGELARGRFNPDDPRFADVLAALSRVPAISSDLTRSPAGRRYAALASAAPLARTGSAATRYSARDLADFAGAAALMWLAAAGGSSEVAALSSRPNIDANGDVAALARADDDTLKLLRSEVKSGAVELIAQPSGEPVLPLLVDSAGKTSLDPNVIEMHASADAGRMIDDAIAAVSRFEGSSRAVGIYSPFGAYDDATADTMALHKAAYGLFTDRVVKGIGAGESAEAVAAAQSAGFHAYTLQTGKDRSLKALFWDQSDSDSLSATPVSWPASAMGDRIAAIARSAGATAASVPGPRVVVLSIDADGAWTRRADRQAVLEHIAARLSDAPGFSAQTPAAYLASAGPGAVAYGFPAACSAGSFELWMGSSAQASLWTALVAARSAAGADSALDQPKTREPLLQAESSIWFESVALPLPSATLDRRLRQYRGLLTQMYRAVGRPAPSPLAPVRTEAPSVLSTPAP